MSQSALDVVDVLVESGDALDCFRSETPARTEVRPRRHPLDSARGNAPRVASRKRQRKRRRTLGRFEWTIGVTVFAAGLLIGTLLAGPSFPNESAAKAIRPAALATVAQPPAASAHLARDEQGTAGSDSVPATVDSAKAELTAASLRPVVQSETAGHRGTLIVTSTPRGASVFVNGELKGETPIELHDQPAGSRALRLDLDGYARWSRAIRVMANDATTVSAQLSRVD